VATQLVASQIVLSSIELVTGILFIYFINKTNIFHRCVAMLKDCSVAVTKHKHNDHFSLKC
jgi:hypothetical protein